MAQISDLAHRLAYHEAAHTVIAVALDLEVDEVSIDLQRGTGETRRSGPDPSTVDEGMQLLVAGRLGEEMRFANATGTVSDDAVLADLSGLAPSGALAKAVVEVRGMLQRWDVHVDALAAALIRHRRLDRDDICYVLDGDVSYIRKLLPNWEPDCGPSIDGCPGRLNEVRTLRAPPYSAGTRVKGWRNPNTI